MKRSHVLLRNITLNFFAQFWLLGLNFLTIPYILRKFGTTKYGLLVLLNTIPAYFTILDLGIIPALVKYIAEFKTKNKNLKDLLGTALFIYLFLTIFWGGIIFFSANFLTGNILKIPPELRITALMALKLIAINFVLSSLGIFFSTIPQALQRFEIFNIKNIFIGTFIPLGTIILLIFNKDIVEIIYLHIAVNFIILLIFCFIAKRLLPQTPFVLNFSFKYFRKLLSFGGFKFISNINARVFFQLNQFLIASFLPIQFVSFYSIPASLVQKIIGLLPNITTPIFPLTSELNSLKLKNKLISLYKHSIKTTNILIIPLFLFLFFFAHPLLSFWIGKDFANQSALILKILSIAYLIASFSGVPTVIAEGVGKPKIPTIFSTVNVILYLIFAILLIPSFKAIGAALAIFLSTILQVPIFVYSVTSKIIKIDYLSFYLNFYFKLILLGVFSIFPWSLLSSFLTSPWQLGSLFIFSGITYVVVSLLSKTINKNDKKVVKNFFKIFFKIQ